MQFVLKNCTFEQLVVSSCGHDLLYGYLLQIYRYTVYLSCHGCVDDLHIFWCFEVGDSGWCMGLVGVLPLVEIDMLLKIRFETGHLKQTNILMKQNKITHFFAATIWNTGTFNFLLCLQLPGICKGECSVVVICTRQGLVNVNVLVYWESFNTLPLKALATSSYLL